MGEVGEIKVPVIVESVRVEIAKLELKPGDVVLIKIISPTSGRNEMWDQCADLWQALRESLTYQGVVDPPPVVVMSGDVEFSTLNLPPVALDQLTDQVVTRLERRAEEERLRQRTLEESLTNPNPQVQTGGINDPLLSDLRKANKRLARGKPPFKEGWPVLRGLSGEPT